MANRDSSPVEMGVFLEGETMVWGSAAFGSTTSLERAMI